MALSLRFNSPFVPSFSHDPLPFLLDTLGTAREQIDLCIDLLGVEAVVAQVARLRDRGVKVRWILGMNQGAQEQVDEGAVERTMLKYGFRKQTDWRTIRSQNALFAQCFAVIDCQRVFFCTAPLTAEGLYLQDSFYLVVDSAEFAAAFIKAADIYWNDSTMISRDAGLKDFIPEFVSAIEAVNVGPDQRISAFFMPDDGKIVAEKLIEVISQAEGTLHFALPSLADPLLVDALEERARSGIQIRGVLDAHRCRIEHFERAPALRALALAGKIRFLRAFGKGQDGFADLMQLRMVAADGQWVYLAGERLDLRSDVRWQGDTAFVIDSLPVARQATQAIDQLVDLARDGGHRFSLWAHKERYAFPQAWTIEPARKPVARPQLVRAAVAVKPVAKTVVKTAVKKAAAAKKVAVARKVTKLKSAKAPAKKKIAASAKRKAA